MRLQCFTFCLTAAGIIAAMTVVATGAEPPARTIKVSAASQIDVVPDEVVLSLSVNAEDKKDLLLAKSENDKRTRQILNALRNRHIEEKYIQIDCLEIEPRYAKDTEELRAFAATRGIDITLRDFDLLEPVLADALQAGANRVRGILFRTTKHRQQQFEARRLAVVYAKEKAGHLAELNGLALGKAIAIEESTEGNIHTPVSASVAPLPEANATSVQMHLVSARDDEAEKKNAPSAGSGALTTIAPGVITISATVTITFELTERKQ
jgi:uncharacterized protein